MAKKKNGRKVNLSGKPKLSLDVKRSDGKSGTPSTATVPRLGMLNRRRRLLKNGSQQIHPEDENSLRRELEDLIIRRPENDPRLASRVKRMSLSSLIDLEQGLRYLDSEKGFVICGSRVVVKSPRKKSLHKNANKSQDAFEPFKAAFGPKGRAKRPKLLADNYESLLHRANKSQDAYEEITAASSFVNGHRRFRKSSPCSKRSLRPE